VARRGSWAALIARWWTGGAAVAAGVHIRFGCTVATRRAVLVLLLLVLVGGRWCVCDWWWALLEGTRRALLECARWSLLIAAQRSGLMRRKVMWVCRRHGLGHGRICAGGCAVRVHARRRRCGGRRGEHWCARVHISRGRRERHCHLCMCPIRVRARWREGRRDCACGRNGWRYGWTRTGRHAVRLELLL
jgi:hypothetical protein